MSKYQQWKEALVYGKNPCWGCQKEGKDRHGDNFHCYGEGKGGHCHVCGCTIRSDEYKGEGDNVVEYEEWEINIMAKEFTNEDHDKLKEITTFDPKGYRGLNKEVCQHF